MQVYASCLLHATTRRHGLWCDPLGTAAAENAKDLALATSDPGPGPVRSPPALGTPAAATAVTTARLPPCLSRLHAPPPGPPESASAAPLGATPGMARRETLGGMLGVVGDAGSGWCDAQGRRAYLEDHCAVV